ncbi:hypothetical protein Vretimale_17103 [Volvox reticuliferus]|uniref:Uncharacterized protein n=1 Tax=Volvox reticuliferus TaxID=1737510 RepID=A0A8J4GSD4_9CHLO|nr:hypothetical protein Vretimale_17103 [Volvox reticuliferus]
MAALLAGGANIAARCWSEGNDWISGPAGSTPLHLAARRGDIELCKMVMSHYLEILRDNGTPDPRLHSDARGMQPYHRAAERGCRELAEATSLARCSGTPLGGSPRFSLNGDSGDGYPGGCSPPLMPTILSVPGATSALQTVRECHPTDEADAHGLDNVGMEGTSTLASQRAVWCAPQALLGPSGGSAFQGLDSLRRPLAGPGTSAAAADADTAGVIVVRRVSGEYITGRVVAGGSGDLIGGSPGLGAMYLPGALGCETLGSGSINRYRMGGCGMSVTTGRPISGKLQVSAGSCTTAGMVVAAAGEVSAFGGAAPGTIGSDTSEDYCGVCFERPAFLHIKPCKHALCGGFRHVLRHHILPNELRIFVGIRSLLISISLSWNIRKTLLCLPFSAWWYRLALRVKGSTLRKWWWRRPIGKLLRYRLLSRIEERPAVHLTPVRS